MAKVHAPVSPEKVNPLTMSVKKTILCVDNEQSLSIQKVTFETRGYRVMTCNTAEEAVKVFVRKGVDIVVSSAVLPDATATEMVKRLKTISPEIPVVLLSPHMRGFHTDAPADLLLRKASSAPAQLLEHIRILLAKRRGPRRAGSNAVSKNQAC
ncbi:MAG: response regulator [Acidobacteria bacterium]|nr:MAG: response regulator [Acidobacteriota bacterium]